MSLFHKPRILKQARTTQISYELPHRVYCTKVYPVKASNGSTIVLYGHINGVRVIWRGGKPLKCAASRSEEQIAKGQAEQQNSVEHDGLSTDNPYEDEEAVDTSHGLPVVVQELDLTFDTQVLSIAYPPLPTHKRAGSPIPSVFETHMVVALACGDSSVRVVSLPLEPPTEENRRKLSKLSPEKYVAVASVPAGPKSHHHSPSHLSLTWTERELFASGESQGPQNLEWDLLLASAGADMSGVVFLTRIPLAGENGQHLPRSTVAKDKGTTYVPFRRIHVSSQPTSLAFNTSTFPSRRHTQLLIAERNGSARVYDSLGAHPRQSSADIDGDSIITLSGSNKGVWVAHLTTPYHLRHSVTTDKVSPGLTRHRPILAAEWMSHGHSVLILTADGEFGQWDVEGAASPELKARGTLSSASTSDNTSTSRRSQSGLAPMTPNTRAAKAQRLFSSPSPTATSAAPRGGLSVIARGFNDEGESVILWYGNEVYTIPNLEAFRKRSEEGSRGTGSLYGPELSRIEGLNLRGEMLTSAVQLPRADSRDSHSQPDVVASANSRLLVLTKQISRLPSIGNSALAQWDEDEEMLDEEDDRGALHLLDREELGLVAIDKMADSMSGSRLFGRSHGRKVLFAAS